MRVLLVADVSAEQVRGGAERMLVRHFRALNAAGMRVSVLTRMPTPDARPLVTLEGGVAEHRLPFDGGRGLAGLRQLARGAATWWRLHATVFDMVIAEQPFVMWALEKAGCRLPRLQVCHSFAFEEYATRYGLDWNLRHRLAAASMRRLEGRLYRSAERMLVLSRFTQQRLGEVFGIDSRRIDVAPGGVAPVNLTGADERQAIRTELGWDGPVVVTLRNLVPRTGVDLLVQAAAIARVERPDLRWCVMGNGPLQEPLTRLAERLGVADRIEFAGFLPEKAVQQRLQAADAFMLPSRSLEGFGLVTIEANACGLPVVGTPVAANCEVIPSLPFNRLAAAATPDALATSLLAMLEELESGNRQQVREKLCEATRNKYDWRYHDAALVEAVRALTG